LANICGKAHIGVDSKAKLIHSGMATAANGHDRQVLGEQAKNRPKSKVRSKGEASVSGARADLRLRQGALPRIGQERRAAVRGLRVGESVPGPKAIVGGELESVRPIVGVVLEMASITS